MNDQMKLIITNIQLSLTAFAGQLNIAAQQDDGNISREEKKKIDAINKATEKYSKALDKYL